MASWQIRETDAFCLSCRSFYYLRLTYLRVHVSIVIDAVPFTDGMVMWAHNHKAKQYTSTFWTKLVSTRIRIKDSNFAWLLSTCHLSMCSDPQQVCLHEFTRKSVVTIQNDWLSFHFSSSGVSNQWLSLVTLHIIVG